MSLYDAPGAPLSPDSSPSTPDLSPGLPHQELERAAARLRSVEVLLADLSERLAVAARQVAAEAGLIDPTTSAETNPGQVPQGRGRRG